MQSKAWRAYAAGDFTTAFRIKVAVEPTTQGKLIQVATTRLEIQNWYDEALLYIAYCLIIEACLWKSFQKWFCLTKRVVYRKKWRWCSLFFHRFSFGCWKWITSTVVRKSRNSSSYLIHTVFTYNLCWIFCFIGKTYFGLLQITVRSLSDMCAGMETVQVGWEWRQNQSADRTLQTWTHQRWNTN